ncbi:MAG: DUF805 domain-containing protein [Eubacterium sp.]|nr:DUF805 domain-containing protein [Eubacterium sp.]
MSITEAISSVLHNYANFSGRARRSEYWYWTLAVSVINSILTTIGQNSNIALITGLAGIFSLATLIPGLAVGVRRLHDIGKSGGWLFIALVPIVGWILLLVWYFRDSDPGDNQYGPCPK